MRAPLAPPRLSEPRKDDGCGPGGRDELRDGEAGGEDLRLERGDVGVADEFVVDGGDGVLPDQLFLGNQRAEVADDGAHVAVGELEPGAGEGVGELAAGSAWKRLPISS